MVLGAGWADDRQKDRVATYLAALCEAEGAVALSFISEAWIRKMSQRTGETEAEFRERAGALRPSQAEDRAEVISAMLTARQDGERITLVKMGEIERRADGKPVRVAVQPDRDEPYRFESPWARLIAETPPSPMQREAARMALDGLARLCGLELHSLPAAGRA